MKLPLFALLCWFAGITSCGSSQGPATDGGPLDCDPLPDAAVCNSLSVGTAPAVVPMKVAASAPAFTGGTISNGLYYATSMLRYTGPGGEAGPLAENHRAALLVSGNTAQLIDSKNGCPGLGVNLTLTPSGNAVTLQLTCPVASSTSAQFTATLTTFTLYADGRLTIFTRQ